MLSDVFFFLVLFCSESSEEESTGEKEEEIGAHNEVSAETEVPAEHASNTQTGEGWRKNRQGRGCLLFLHALPKN